MQKAIMTDDKQDIKLRGSGFQSVTAGISAVSISTTSAGALAQWVC